MNSSNLPAPVFVKILFLFSLWKFLPGMTTAMSRRRVSCRELGQPDCDGWLWKKRKETSVFLAQKWQRFWFILKGPSLYWYSSQQVQINLNVCSLQTQMIYIVGLKDEISKILVSVVFKYSFYLCLNLSCVLYWIISFTAGWEGRGFCQYSQLQHRKCWRTQAKKVRTNPQKVLLTGFYALILGVF